MKINRRVTSVAAAAALVAAGGAQAWSSIPNRSPQLGLSVATPKVQVERFAGDPFIWADLGTYVGVRGSSITFEAVPRADGTADIWQVHHDEGGGIHRDRKLTLPSRGPLALGLPDFLQVSIRNAQGAVVSESTVGFCPGGQASRLDGSGPDEPTMPWTCGSDLTRRIVYGLDQGWAAPVGPDLLSNFQAPDGDYTVTMRIAQPYVTQFGIPSDQAKAQLTLSVKTVSCEDVFGGGCVGAGGEAALTRLDPVTRALAADVNPRAARDSTLSTSPSLRRLAGQRVHGGPEAVGGGRNGHESPDHGVENAGEPGRGSGLPDLVPLPAFGIEAFTDETGRDQLAFGANLANLGQGPLVVEGYRNGQDTMRAQQFEYRDGKPVRSFPAGAFEYDARDGHDHWHFEDVALYDLVRTDGSVTRSGKQAFCLAPTDPIDLTIRGAVQRVDAGRMWSQCSGATALWLREVLPAGWGDTYFQWLPGQSFDITGLPNGTYQVRVTTNFRGAIHETRTDNNVSLRTVELGGKAGARTVSVR